MGLHGSPIRSGPAQVAAQKEIMQFGPNNKIFRLPKYKLLY